MPRVHHVAASCVCAAVIFICGAFAAGLRQSTPKDKELHCRYDVSSRRNYWYKEWQLTLGCKTKKTPAGGVLDPTFAAYYNLAAVPTRGEWFDVVRWANKSRNCDKHPESTTCMSCSMNIPKFVAEKRVVPFGVYDGWWLYPEPGATCGMCYKILLPSGTLSARCKKAKSAGNYELYETYPECPGNGNSSYITTSKQPWAWNAKLYKDKATGLPYLIGINVEWYDLDSPLEYGVSYLMKGRQPDGMGSWPLRVQPIPCPVGKNKLEYAFIRGDFNGNYFWKLQLAGQRIQVASVHMRWHGSSKWYTALRSGDRKDTGYGDADGHWQVSTNELYPKTRKVDIKIFCGDGSKPKVERGLVPAKMMCSWQDPGCKRHMGKVQC